MLVEFATAAVLITGGADPQFVSRDIKLAMAAALVGAGGEKRYEPPELVERPAPATGVSPKSGSMPAPVRGRSNNEPERDAPPVGASKPVAGRLPAPIQEQRFAQASPSNEELLRRLERLEEENRRLREKDKSSSLPSGSSLNTNMERRSAPSQMIPGWRLSLYPWNAEGFINGDPLKVFNIRNRRISALVGQRPPSRDNIMETYFGHTNEMFVYKLEGWLHVTREGTYTLGIEINCGHGHPCNLLARLGEQQLFSERHQRFENKMLFQSRELPVGDYWMEIVFNIATSRFNKFEPQRANIYPQIRGPGEYNFRDFGPQELLTEANASIPGGPPR